METHESRTVSGNQEPGLRNLSQHIRPGLDQLLMTLVGLLVDPGKEKNGWRVIRSECWTRRIVRLGTQPADPSASNGRVQFFSPTLCIFTVRDQEAHSSGGAKMNITGILPDLDPMHPRQRLLETCRSHRMGTGHAEGIIGELAGQKSSTLDLSNESKT